MIVTIDGPAGAGKSSAARGLAARLGFRFLDTGAMYRAATLACQRRGVELAHERQVAETVCQARITVDGERVFLDGEDVTQAVRTPEVTQGTSTVASNVAVRRVLVESQRLAAQECDLVAEGRDQGTVVFPHAECKFFLTADPRERAARRQRDLAGSGAAVTMEELLVLQAERDRRDESREVGPLKPADDAIHVDTSGLGEAEVIDLLERQVRARLGAT